MANPLPAFDGTECDSCFDAIEEGDDVFFDAGERLCTKCAQADGIVCDCGRYKRSKYRACYECSQNS